MAKKITEAKMERLSTALDAYNRATSAVQRAETFENVKAEIRAVNVLMDCVADIDGYAVAAGLPSKALAEHAAKHVTRWLLSA